MITSTIAEILILIELLFLCFFNYFKINNSIEAALTTRLVRLL